MSLRPAIFALLTALPFVSATPVHAQNKLIVGMPTTPPNIVLMPLHVGKDLGFFKQEGIDIETVELEGGVKAFRAMVAGSVDIASSPGPFSIVGRAKGAATKAAVLHALVGERPLAPAVAGLLATGSTSGRAMALGLCTAIDLVDRTLRVR
jgi:ABC-type nitrate/sulfonate/bicarbonate transport system substrate-binding protein